MSDDRCSERRRCGGRPAQGTRSTPQHTAAHGTRHDKHNKKNAQMYLMGWSSSCGLRNQNTSFERALMRQPRHTCRMMLISLMLSTSSAAAAMARKSTAGQPSGPLMRTNTTSVNHLRRRRGRGRGGQRSGRRARRCHAGREAKERCERRPPASRRPNKQGGAALRCAALRCAARRGAALRCAGPPTPSSHLQVDAHNLRKVVLHGVGDVAPKVKAARRRREP